MRRRLLEAASTKANEAASGNNSPAMQPVTGQAHPTASPPVNLSAPAQASSSGGGGSAVAVAAVATAAVTPNGGGFRAVAAAPGQNATVYLPENDEFGYSMIAAFSDMETVFLACISTLLPLVVALGLAFGIRHMWRKYRDRRCSMSSGLPGYRGVCSRDDTTESLHHRPHSRSSSIQQSTQILSAQDLVNGMDGPRYMCESEVMDEVSLAVDGATEYSTPISQANKNVNGNIITLTLRNNHLIVETEERAVTMESTRFRQYQDNGCSVIVEVPPAFQSDAIDVNRESSDDIMGHSTDEQALVHCEISGDRSSAFDNTKIFGSTNTGLSQSDLSICSSQDGGSGGGARGINPSYRYGNQLEYDADHFGYPLCTTLDSGGTSNACTATGSSKWVEFDRSPDTDDVLLSTGESAVSNCGAPANVVLDNRALTPDSSIGNNVESSQDSGSSLEQQDSTETSDSGADTTIRSNPNFKAQINGAPMEPSETDALMPSITTKPIITGAILKDEASLQEDTFQEQQRKLGNGTLTPEHCKIVELHTDNNMRTEQKNKDLNNTTTKPEGSAFVPTHKRTGSIPPRLIEDGLEIERKKGLDIYSQIKTSTKSILPGLSPKFELLQNEISPVDEKES